MTGRAPRTPLTERVVLVQDRLAMDPLSTQLFVITNRRYTPLLAARMISSLRTS